MKLRFWSFTCDCPNYYSFLSSYIYSFKRERDNNNRGIYHGSPLVLNGEQVNSRTFFFGTTLVRPSRHHACSMVCICTPFSHYMNACNFIHNLSKINSNYNSNSLHHGLTMKTEKFSIFTVKSALQEREHPQACTVVGGGEIG